MSPTPFDQVPLERFLLRMILPCVFLIAFCFLSVGVVATSPEFQQVRAPKKVVPVWTASVNHYTSLALDVTHLPQYCLLGNAVNEYEQSQCDASLWEILKSSCLAIAPLLIIFSALRFAWSQMMTTYQRARHEIHTGSPRKGVVTDPPYGESGFYSWFHCFSSVAVELDSKEQITVYYAVDEPLPGAGTKLLVHDIGSAFGIPRQVATVYTPHVKIVSGG